METQTKLLNDWDVLLRSQETERDELKNKHELDRETLYRSNKNQFDSIPVWRGYGQ